jgi:hypothetical protein
MKESRMYFTCTNYAMRKFVILKGTNGRPVICLALYVIVLVTQTDILFPRSKEECSVRSKTWWKRFHCAHEHTRSMFMPAHHLSYFVTFFIVAWTNSSTAETHYLRLLFNNTQSFVIRCMFRMLTKCESGYWIRIT